MRRIIFSMLLVAAAGIAEIKPAPLFTNFAVLQQNEPVRIWGTAGTGEQVTVEFAGQVKSAVADSNGNWMVTLDPMPASSMPRVLSILSPASNYKFQISNVVVGEVWFAGGQSNMQTTMAYYKKTTQADINSANDPLLRMVTVPANFYKGHSDKKPQWKDSNPMTVPEFSATAYYFARNLREKLNVPVGVISCAVGGTPAEAWMSRETLASHPDLRRTLEAYEKQFETEFTDKNSYLEYVKKYEEESSLWYRRRSAGEPPGPRPKQKMGPHNFKRPCGLYENMFLQTVPYTLRGIIWYQGEENASAQAGFIYRTVFSGLISNWREQFRNENLPFLFVQLATVGTGDDKTAYWPELRESQKWVEENVRHTGMAVLVDGGEENSVHPHSKDKAGYRLSLLARHLVYGEKKLLCRGPVLREVCSRNNALELSFESAGDGLILKPEPVSAFEICGSGGNYVPAQAVLADGRILVSSSEVSDPCSVRYGWRKGFVPTLFNSEGLPASPFRTDNFPAESRGRYYLDRPSG